MMSLVMMGDGVEWVGSGSACGLSREGIEGNDSGGVLWRLWSASSI